MALDDLVAGLSASSLSDTDAYRQVCRAAATNAVTFEHFRSHPHYTRVLEHVTEAQGRQYLDEIRLTDSKLLEYPQWFKANDDHGNPALSFYEFIGQVSPTTLRYVKVLADLRKLFSKSVRSVVEVGGGYGGQARIWCAREILVGNYTIVDLPEPLALAREFLGNFSGVSGRVNYVNGEEFVHARPRQYGAPADLFISNYALTECAPDVLRAYVERIALNCPRGYITGNAQEKLLFELLASKNPQRLDEVPLTGPGNFICVWGAS